MAYLKCYTDFAKSFKNELDSIMQSCDCVHDLDQCDGCPLHNNCLRDSSIEDIWSGVSVMAIADFYEYSEDVCNADVTEDDRIALAADDARKAEIERDITDR